MSLHKARPDEKVADPTKPASTVMIAGRVAGTHENPTEHVKTKEEENELLKTHKEHEEKMKKVAKDTFDPKTGEPKEKSIDFGPDPAGDAMQAPAVDSHMKASPEEVKKNVEAEKKVDKK